MACFRNISLFAGLLVFAAPSAHAWEKHRTLMPSILETLSPAAKLELTERRKPPCREDELRLYRNLAAETQLRTDYEPPPTSPGGCLGSYKVSGFEILAGGFIDEPDQSFDLELPTSADPDGERKWMGGIHGSTSQGFRHMYFGGWKPLHPLASLQFPPWALGQAPTRANIFGERARREIRAGNKLWGYRLLAWSAHYIQDLTQPFHATQIPSLWMVPWSKLFSGFIPEATRTISNYHWAYEDFLLYELTRSGRSKLAECMLKPSTHATIPQTLAAYATEDFPADLALTVAQASRALAAPIGSALIDYFGPKLKEPGFDLAHTGNPLDYAALDQRTDLKNAREALFTANCPALANASVATQLLVEWALFSPLATSNATPDK